ncbi:MAG: hypothetical protein Q9165_006166 [Trypethelium subeluteriae]
MDKAVAASSISIIESGNHEIKKSTMNLNDSINSRVPNIFHVENVSSGISAEDGVRVCGIHEYKQAAQTLAEAFAEDDVAMYFIDTPDREHWTEEQKWNLHTQILEYVTYAHVMKGLVLTAGEDYGCVALWSSNVFAIKLVLTQPPSSGRPDRMPPGHNMDDLYTIFRSGMWRLYFQLSSEGKKRFFTEFLPLLHDAKARTLGDRDHDSWYLVYLGTKKAARGKGFAKKVVERVTKMADVQNKACYLESSNDKNPAIYMRWGFELARKVVLQRGPENIELDIMIREPNPKTSEARNGLGKTTKAWMNDGIQVAMESEDNRQPC